MGFLDRLFPGRGTEVDNTLLEKVMEGVTADPSPVNLRTLYAAFLKSRLLVPLAPSPDLPDTERPAVLKTETKVNIPAVQDPQGRLKWLVFTNFSALQAWQQGSGCVYWTGQEVCAMALKSGITALLISSGKAAGELHQWAIQAMADGAVPQEDGKAGVQPNRLIPGTSVRVGLPAPPPSGPVLDALRASFGKHPDIREVYLVELQSGQGPPRWAMGIQFHSSAEEKIKLVFEALSGDLKPLVGQGKYWDFVALREGENLSEAIRKTRNRIYPGPKDD